MVNYKFYGQIYFPSISMFSSPVVTYNYISSSPFRVQRFITIKTLQNTTHSYSVLPSQIPKPKFVTQLPLQLFLSRIHHRNRIANSDSDTEIVQKVHIDSWIEVKSDQVALSFLCSIRKSTLFMFEGSLWFTHRWDRDSEDAGE